MTDWELLQEYRNSHAHAAFQTLVERHVDFVYSCARRRVRDGHLAEDVTQIVFTVLARRAGDLKPNVPLKGWLFNAVRFAAANQLRKQRRRQQTEREAVAMTRTFDDPTQYDQAWKALDPHLEDGLSRLKESERNAILLRFFENRSLKEVGIALAIDPNTAAKRISRGIARLRDFFSRKGIAIPDAAVETGLPRQTTSAPAGSAAIIATLAIASAAQSASASATTIAATEVIRSMIWASSRLPLSIAAAILAFIGGVILHQITSKPTGAAVAQQQSPPVTQGIAPGWPIRLPGHVTGTPAVANLDGGNKLCIIIPTMWSSGRDVAHPNPRLERLLHAYRLDGTTPAGWPAVITDLATRQADQQKALGDADVWYSSPSIYDRDGDGRHEIFILNRLGIMAISSSLAGPSVERIAPQGDGWSTIPVADVNGDGIGDVLAGNAVATVEGDPIPGWPARRVLQGGFGASIADVDGDGLAEIYHSLYADRASIAGYDRFGKILPGWPQKIYRHSMPGPVIGDVDGDGLADVVVGSGAFIQAWTWDGQPLKSTRPRGILTGVFKEDTENRNLSSPSLADLDGDGALEIICFNWHAKTLHAWRGKDGKGLHRPDGLIAKLDEAPSITGVSVADLGGDGVMDFFVGTHWVQLSKDGSTKAINMIPAPAQTYGQPSIADLDDDDLAEVIFGLADGHVYVYHTALSLKKKHNYWPTHRRNYHRTNAVDSATVRSEKEPKLTPSDEIQIEVLDADTQRPLTNAIVTIEFAEGEFKARVDSSGKFTAPARGQPVVTLTASADGYAPLTATHETYRGFPDARRFALPKSVPLGGIIRDVDGRPIPHATVYISARAKLATELLDLRDLIVQTDAQGKWTLNKLPEKFDALYLRVEHPLYLPDSARIALNEQSLKSLREGTMPFVLRRPQPELPPQTILRGRP
jgi:RNA polymerase sigma factor (sigma-70 family)